MSLCRFFKRRKCYILYNIPKKYTFSVDEKSVVYFLNSADLNFFLISKTKWHQLISFNDNKIKTDCVANSFMFSFIILNTFMQNIDQCDAKRK